MFQEFWAMDLMREMGNEKWEVGCGKISKPDILEWEVGPLKVGSGTQTRIPVFKISYSGRPRSFGQNCFTFLGGNVWATCSMVTLPRGQWHTSPRFATGVKKTVLDTRGSGIVLADCVSSPRSSHVTSFAEALARQALLRHLVLLGLA